MRFETTDDFVKIDQVTAFERELLHRALTNRLVSAASGGTKLTAEAAVFLANTHQFSSLQTLVIRKASNLLLVAECLTDEMPRFAEEPLRLATTMVLQLETEAIIFGHLQELQQWTPESFA